MLTSRLPLCYLRLDQPFFYLQSLVNFCACRFHFIYDLESLKVKGSLEIETVLYFRGDKDIEMVKKKNLVFK